MLAKIRNATGLIITAFLAVGAAFIITMFLDDSRQRRPQAERKDTAIGVVEGEEILISMYDQALQNQLDRLRGSSQRPVSDAIADRLKENVWREFVDRVLMTQQFESLGLRITDDMIWEELTNNPPPGLQGLFMNSEGVFDDAAYQQALYSGSSEFWMQAESYVRNDALPGKMLQLMAEASVRVSSDEIQRAFLEQNDEARIRYIFVAPQNISEVELSADELLAHYEEHKTEYERPAQARLGYVKLPKGPSEEDIANARGRIDSVVEKLGRGTDFGLLARVHSDDPGSAPSDGQLDWFARGKMVPEFDEVAFALEPGTLSAPFRTDYGWHVVRVDEQRTTEAGVEEIKAAHILKRVRASAATREAQHQRMRQLADAARSSGGLEPHAAELPYLTTPPFPEPPQNSMMSGPSRIPTLGQLEGATEFAFGNEAGVTSGVYESDDAYYLLQVEERIEAVIPPFIEVESRVRMQAERDKRKTLALAKGQEMGERAAAGASLAEIAAALDLSVEEPEEPLRRNSYVQGIGTRTEVTGAAFHLEVGARSDAIVMEERGITAVVEVLERTPADATLLVDQREDLIANLRSQKKAAAFRSWLEEMRATADIVDNRDQFYRSTADTTEVASS